MVRHEAGEALGALGHQDSLDLLRRFYEREGECPEVRETCEIAIARLEWLRTEEGQMSIAQGDVRSEFTSIDPAPPTSPQSNHNHPQDPSSLHHEPIQPQIEQLQQTLTDPTLPLFPRYRAMFRLRNLVAKYPSLAIPALAAGFKDTSALFRHEIAFVFGQLAHPDSAPYLLPVARDVNEHAMVRHEAVEALGGIAGEVDSVEGWLKEMVHDSERVVRESAVVALDMAEWERSGELEYALIPGKEGEGVKVEVSA